MGKIVYTTDNEFVKSSLSSMSGNDKLEVLRRERAKLFPAFNIYCAMESQKILPQTYSTTHEYVIGWYYKILDLNEEAIFNVPDVIKYFME